MTNELPPLEQQLVALCHKRAALRRRLVTLKHTRLPTGTLLIEQQGNDIVVTITPHELTADPLVVDVEIAELWQQINALTAQIDQLEAEIEANEYDHTAA